MLAKVGPDGGLPVATQCPLRDRLFAIFKLIGECVTQRGDVRRHTPLSARRPGISRQVPRILLGHPQQSFLLCSTLQCRPPPPPYLARGLSTFFRGTIPRAPGAKKEGPPLFLFSLMCLSYRRPAWTRRLCLLRSSSSISSAVTVITLTSGSTESSASQAPSYT
jgi:hypothetical protein